MGRLVDCDGEGSPPAGVEGVVWPQPVLAVALQVAPLMIARALSNVDDVSGVGGLVHAGPRGWRRSATGGCWPRQPAVVFALQVAASITETVLRGGGAGPGALLATNRVSVASLMASPSGPPRTLNVIADLATAGCWRRVAGGGVDHRHGGLVVVADIERAGRRSTTNGTGKFPTSTVGGDCAQPDGGPA